ASDVTTPFATPRLTMNWPGSAPVEDAGWFAVNAPVSLNPELVSRPSYSAATSPENGEAFRVTPRAITDAAGDALALGNQRDFGTDLTAGLVRGYRETQPVAGPGLSAAVPAPI